MNGREVEAGIDGFVYLSDYGDVIPADDVQSQDDLFDAVCGGEDAFVGLVQDYVDGLVEAF